MLVYVLTKVKDYFIGGQLRRGSPSANRHPHPAT
jgi:hypothetical protein